MPRRRAASTSLPAAARRHIVPHVTPHSASPVRVLSLCPTPLDLVGRGGCHPHPPPTPSSRGTPSHCRHTRQVASPPPRDACFVPVGLLGRTARRVSSEHEKCNDVVLTLLRLVAQPRGVTKAAGVNNRAGRGSLCDDNARGRRGRNGRERSWRH
jgi:hypothetical protein